MNINEILQTINNIEKQLKQIKKQLLEEEKTEYRAFVYCHILPNKKYYIGTAKEPKQRWLNGEGYRANKEFYSDIKKYKWENIKHLILYKCQDYKDAESIEAFCISLYASREYGYNKRASLGEYPKDSENRKECERNFNNMVTNFNAKANEEAIKKLNKIYKERGREYENSK